jgi:hypothetical protein
MSGLGPPPKKGGGPDSFSPSLVVSFDLFSL